MERDGPPGQRVLDFLDLVRAVHVEVKDRDAGAAEGVVDEIVPGQAFRLDGTPVVELHHEHHLERQGMVRDEIEVPALDHVEGDPAGHPFQARSHRDHVGHANLRHDPVFPGHRLLQGTQERPLRRAHEKGHFFIREIPFRTFLLSCRKNLHKTHAGRRQEKDDNRRGQNF